jgi:hypothetical protein
MGAAKAAAAATGSVLLVLLLLQLPLIWRGLSRQRCRVVLLLKGCGTKKLLVLLLLGAAC